MNEHKITDLQQFLELWNDFDPDTGERRWDRMLEYYHDDIFFKDAVQAIHGKKAFSAMAERLARRSRNLQLVVHNSIMQGDLIFVEWEMIIAYKRFPKSSVFGNSRLTLKDGKIIEQRDYYDLWGDIFDNIFFLARAYRWFMRKGFG
ncbi:MAG: nuclear transport factor 2 family protein [Spirochaetaceae bacterium]|nr:MAG: nuclear transport factor 2 family protein [Spirochaetaceae bacterium]